MTLDFLSENLHHSLPSLVLLIDLLLMVFIVRVRVKVNRQITIVLALIGVGIAATTVVDLFSEYSLDAIHVLDHSMFAAIILVCAKLLMSGADLAVFDFFIFLEEDVFDRFQYLLAQSVMFLSGKMRKIQTGNLNFNMTVVIIGFVICLLLSF